MIMKKRLFVMAMASVALAGCVSDEVAEVAQKNETVKIMFDTPVLYDNALSRAIPGEIGEKYNKLEKFKIFAKKYNEYNASAATGGYAGWDNATNVAFNGQDVVYDNSVDGWAPKNNNEYYYWEPGIQLVFSACSPAEILTNATYNATGLTITDYTVETAPEKQYDLLFSQRVYDADASKMNHASTSYTGVPFVFQHALSSVHVAIENETLAAEEESEQLDITLKSITFEGVFTTGTFNEVITDATSSSNAYYKQYVRKDRNNNEGNVDPSWTLGSTKGTYNVYDKDNSTGVLFPEASSHIVEYIEDMVGNNGKAQFNLLIPQDFTNNDDAKIVITYSVEDRSGEIIKKIKLNECDVKEWKMGHKYIYNLRYSLASAKRDKIIFSPSVESWPEGEIIDIEIK